jgi:hypothetical protein
MWWDDNFIDTYPYMVAYHCNLISFLLPFVSMCLCIVIVDSMEAL